MSTADAKLDPTAKTQNHDLTPQEKIDGARDGLRVTFGTNCRGLRSARNHQSVPRRDADDPLGRWASAFARNGARRSWVEACCVARQPLISNASPDVSPSQTTLYFIANNVTHKFEELDHDNHVNVSFYDTASTSWVSYDAKAKVTQDRALIKHFWSPMISGYFGDLGDGALIR